MPPDKKIVGWWGSEPIWRPRTAEEKLAIGLGNDKKKIEAANLGMSLLTNINKVKILEINSKQQHGNS